jgi:uncharacterized protein (TIGR02452 family)
MQRSDTHITEDERKELIALKNKGDLDRKEKLRLAVLQKLFKESSGSSNYDSVSSKENDDLSKTENDYYKKEGEKVFRKSDEEKERSCRYEYTTSEKFAQGGTDAVFKRKNKMKSIIKDTIFRCEILESVLDKRKLTVQEEEELRKLKIKKDANRADYDEDIRYGELMKIKITANEQEYFDFIKGITKLSYYKDAFKTLLPGHQYREWNLDVSTSKEPSNILETCQNAKHASIAVFNQDPIDYAAKLKKEPFKQNPVIVVDCSRMGPGGSWERGDEGIEEQVFLRTTISLAIDKEINDHFYPLKNESVLYAPKNMVFRLNQESDYQTIPKNNNPDFQAFILCTGAVVKQTHIKDDDVSIDANNNRNEQEVYMEKIKNCMATALFNGHDSIIFTALGCYNYGKDYDECADAFLYAIFDPTTLYYRRFKSIIFCVPNNILPPVTETYEVLEAGSKKTMQRTTDMNAVLSQALTIKLHKITNQAVIFSSLTLDTNAAFKKMSNAFKGLKLNS